MRKRDRKIINKFGDSATKAILGVPVSRKALVRLMARLPDSHHRWSAIARMAALRGWPVGKVPVVLAMVSYYREVIKLDECRGM